MEQQRLRVAVWGALLVVVLLALALPAGQPTVAAQAGRFPDFMQVPGGSARGVAVDKTGNVYISVSVGSYIEVRKFTPDGDEVLSVPVGLGTIGGLMVDAEGDLYVAVASGADRGVWRMDREGRLDLLAGSNRIFFANGLAFDDVGTLWVTESVSIAAPGPPPTFGAGSIWRIPREGSAELVVRSPLLAGTGALGNPVPIGANGIAFHHGMLFVTNTEKGTVLTLPVRPDGRVGKLEVLTTLHDVPESPLHGAPIPTAGDGIALDVHGNLYVAVLTRSAIVRINPEDLSQETVAVFKGVSPAGAPPDARLDFPASLFFGTGKGERTNLFVTNLGMGSTQKPPAGQLPWVGSSLVKIDAGVAGLPLH